jgi:hypothetical protein
VSVDPVVIRRPAASVPHVEEVLPQTRSGSARALGITMARAVRVIVVSTSNDKSLSLCTYFKKDCLQVVGNEIFSDFHLGIYRW